MTTLRSAVIGIGLSGLMTAPALATGGIYCEAADGAASVSMSVGHVPALAIVNATIMVGDKTWEIVGTQKGAQPLVVNQAFEGQSMLLVDFGAEAAGENIASLRAFNLMGDDDEFVSGGVFSVKGHGAWVVDCSLRE